ncbi:hypothetical protein KIPB_003181 [Kipferlia bialata]|uniref:Uncharacterized protein n=1 Tax=Kipferlia bialata TaxID=797122 RepID=A0A9K3CV02_9EUKA|nr:hypothetical protein KIPB_003181 [Kipferlia bialata]|eukprot:g3181.t1
MQSDAETGAVGDTETETGGVNGTAANTGAVQQDLNPMPRTDTAVHTLGELADGEVEGEIEGGREGGDTQGQRGEGRYDRVSIPAEGSFDFGWRHRPKGGEAETGEGEGGEEREGEEEGEDGGDGLPGVGVYGDDDERDDAMSLAATLASDSEAPDPTAYSVVACTKDEMNHCLQNISRTLSHIDRCTQLVAATLASTVPDPEQLQGLVRSRYGGRGGRQGGRDRGQGEEESRAEQREREREREMADRVLGCVDRQPVSAPASQSYQYQCVSDMSGPDRLIEGIARLLDTQDILGDASRSLFFISNQADERDFDGFDVTERDNPETRVRAELLLRRLRHDQDRQRRRRQRRRDRRGGADSVTAGEGSDVHEGESVRASDGSGPYRRNTVSSSHSLSLSVASVPPFAHSSGRVGVAGGGGPGGLKTQTPGRPSSAVVRGRGGEREPVYAGHPRDRERSTVIGKSGDLGEYESMSVDQRASASAGRSGMSGRDGDLSLSVDDIDMETDASEGDIDSDRECSCGHATVGGDSVTDDIDSDELSQ